LATAYSEKVLEAQQKFPQKDGDQAASLLDLIFVWYYHIRRAT